MLKSYMLGRVHLVVITLHVINIVKNIIFSYMLYDKFQHKYSELYNVVFSMYQFRG